MFQKMEYRSKRKNITNVASPLQTINEISLEYDFTDPNYEVTEYNTSSKFSVETCPNIAQTQPYEPAFVIGCEQTRHSSCRQLPNHRDITDRGDKP